MSTWIPQRCSWSPRLMLTVNSRMLARVMFCHSSCTASQTPATMLGNGFIPIMFLDIIDHLFAMIQISGFLADNRRLVALARTSWLFLAVWGFAPPRIKTGLSANTWLLKCGLAWGLTISSVYFCAVRPSWNSRPACNFCWHIPIHKWIYLQKHCLEQCTHRKGAHDDKWSAFFAHFKPSLKLEVNVLIIIQYLNGLLELSLSFVWNLNCDWCILATNWTILKTYTEMSF